MLFYSSVILLIVCVFYTVCLSMGTNLRAESRSFFSFPSQNGHPHWCKLLQSNRTKLRLQSITRDKDYIYILENDNVYRVPISNLKTQENVLYMYDQEKQSLFSGYKWYEDEYFQINSSNIERHQREEKSSSKRYDKNNDADKLKLFHFFVTNLDRTRVGEEPSASNYGLLRSYVFNDDDEEYLIFRNKNGRSEMLVDSVRDCRDEDKPAWCHKHGPFHAVIDGTSTTTGFMFYFDISKEKATLIRRPQRVLLGPLVGTNSKGCPFSSDHREMINFPDRNSSNIFGVYIRVGSDRQQMGFNEYGGPESQKENKNEDYFFHLPYGIIHNQRVYLFSKAQRRVYYFNLDQIQTFQTISVAINTVRSRHFNEFFICSPNQKALGESQVSKEYSQVDYFKSASKYVDPAVKEAHNFLNLIIIIVIVSSTVIAFSIFLCLYFYRKNNKRHIRKKQPVVPSTSESDVTDQ